ncbi:DNA topoisomerase III [Paenibacillus sp. GCM10012307]|uniref:DNA topoisomerase n=1 Tax=Paenibacillus roseus TaxID=2798579 RepID=A0A934MQY9_9BACL|nr:DNA topoisomerase III [Paenibacillus roseus]MBJ6361824.1 DNA topoisomerase III [Paenibacillus roseus]
MKVILAEKPDMGRNIAEVLGVKKKNMGYIELQNGDIVTWAIGHLIRLNTPDAYEQFKVWKLDSLPIIPEPMLSEVDPSRKDQFKVIKSLLDQADSCVIATDPGREGEHIGRTIIEACKFKGQLFRLWIQDLTPATIKKGFDNLQLGTAYDNLAAAARARAYADYWIGFTSTRFFTLAAQEVTGEKAVLSAGRVQTPTLRIVYDRELAIENFTPEPFYSLLAQFRTTAGSYTGKWFRLQDGEKINRLDTKEEVESLRKRIEGQPGTLTEYEEKEVKRSAPQLLDSTSIKTAARKQLGFSIDKTDKVLQSIYDKGFVTYPRTSSVHLSANAADQLSERLNTIRSESKYKEVFPEEIKSLKGKSRYVNDEKAAEHHAIVPTGQNPKDLTDEEEKLYEIILLRTLAAHHPEGRDKEVLALTLVAGESFETKTVSVIDLGWRKILKPDAEEEQPESNVLPPLQNGQAVTVQKTEMPIGKTTPPKRLAEDDLVKAMANAGRIIEGDEELAAVLKDLGIGTPATRSGIVKELLNREYMESKRNMIYLTDKGRNFMRLVHDHPLASIELTADFEMKLNEVADGKRSAAATLDEFKSFVQGIVATKDELQVQIRKQLQGQPLFQQQGVEAVGNCPSCKKAVVERKEFYGCSGYKDGCKVTIPKEFLKVKISAKTAGVLLEGKEILFQGIPGQYGPYSLIIKHDGQKLETRKPTLDELTLGACPICKKPVTEKGNFYGCSGFKEGCKFTLPKEFLGRAITANQIRKLLKSGKTDVIKGFEAKGKKFDAAIGYNIQDQKVQFLK